MATGIELVLGFPVARFEVEETKRGYIATMDDVVLRVNEHGDGAALSQFKAQLKAAQWRALEEANFTELGHMRGHIKAITPAGLREFAPWSLEWKFEREFDQQPNDPAAIIGVSITGRYFPTFADWRDPCGTLSPMIFDDEVVRMQEIAKKYIVGVVPWLDAAPWCVLECFY